MLTQAFAIIPVVNIILPFFWLKDLELKICEYIWPVRTLRDSVEEIRFKVDMWSTYGD